ncbi:MAG TPA: serine protease [Gemmataceae bacterium]|nr:serine protease [Gemmataceae bacterium]
MRRISVSLVLTLSILPVPFFEGRAAAEERVAQLQREFARYSGAQLVFTADKLPKGSYFDSMPSLDENERRQAAIIALREVRKLPPRYLADIHLKTIGIFAACISRHNDGFHAYDAKWKGYRYYGVYNGKDGVAAAYYSDAQLPLTLHHEIFHHVDATRDGKPGHDAVFTRDARWQAALSGQEPYPAARIAAADLAALTKLSDGQVLERSVSRYAEKSIGEDKAETARYLMSALPDALVQMATRSQLAGSQRMLHVLHKYQQAAPDGPGIDWFVAVALGRTEKMTAHSGKAEPLLERMRPLLAGEDRPADLDTFASEARSLLEQIAALKDAGLTEVQSRQLVALSAELTHRLLRWRIQPRAEDRTFSIWGQEDDDGINWTLRDDLSRFAVDARRLKEIAALAPDLADRLLRTQLRSLRLIARYQRFIGSHWSLSAGTRQAFERTRAALADSLPDKQSALSRRLRETPLAELSEVIHADGRIDPPLKERRLIFDNPYLKNVDAELADHPKVRAAIRRVQPACVRVDGGSGVNVSAEGHILTAGHVPEKLGARLTVVFPDGQRYTGVCTAYDSHLDLAVVKIKPRGALPFAPVAAEPPEKGTRVVCIGQPGTTTPRGEPTGYKPFHVSTGTIRGFLGNPLGDQSLGRTKHDAWTYWGHSGSPLFNEQGQIVALHNSWDSTTAMRHAVPQQAIVHFLKRHKVPFTTGE